MARRKLTQARMHRKTDQRKAKAAADKTQDAISSKQKTYATYAKR